MKRVLAIVLLAALSACANVDVLLGVRSQKTYTGTGTNLVASWGSAFTPLSISNCVSWWDAADATTLTVSGTNVSAWADKSPTGNTATMATEAYQPKVACSYQGGCNALYFDGVDDLFNHSFTIGNVPWTVFFVARTLRTTSDPTGYNSLLYFGPPVSLQNNTGYRYWMAYQGLNLDSNVYPTNLVVGAVVTRNYNDVDVVTDGVNVYHNDGAYWYNGGSGAHTIGAYNGGEHCKMVLGEIIIYSRALTESERKQVEAYLGTKWAISVTP